MQYQLMSVDTLNDSGSSLFFEGAVFAANLTVKPLAPEQWLPLLVDEPTRELVQAVTEQIHRQHNLILRSEYQLSQLIDSSVDALPEFAYGFMSVWPSIESDWNEMTLNDGSARMLQAFLTTLMLALDEAQTHQQMRDAGYEHLPTLADLLPQLDIMVNEVALAADELMVGQKGQSVNPYKTIGRNDECLCGSGEKFKQCCGR
ncbi:UPF0149 family protein [Vibrio sp. SM6]|uniref:UPF0149 family protein n=1 Tax=Vibrio agarilyticus TaxID=2726741 RepID=A0A7X8TSQ7_9VIBR|nr:SEC-C metal-binding domain-containing protein [Vibrio agarilyticus]NLS13892.1 UPF0149 family protein [Vibrio agarilyticus]